MKKQRKTLRTPYEVMKSIRKPIPPRGKCHGDAKKEQSRKQCRDTERRDDE